MALVDCSNCGRKGQLVADGKRKPCRKCGTMLNSKDGYSASSKRARALRKKSAPPKLGGKKSASKKTDTAKTGGAKGGGKNTKK